MTLIAFQNKLLQALAGIMRKLTHYNQLNPVVGEFLDFNHWSVLGFMLNKLHATKINLSPDLY